MEKTLTLSSGGAMPLVGLGTWQAPPGEVGAAVKVALESGYKHIDCAACYGNEAEIGAVFAEMFAGPTKREDIFITSKLWNSEHAPADVKPAVLKTLADLQVEYLDLYLIHWPQNFEKTQGTTCSFPRNEDGSIRYDLDTKSEETWAAMEALVEEGLVKAIGLSNFNSVQISSIISSCKIKPAVLQVEIHPYFSQEPLVSFCKEQGIVVTAYSPLGTGAEIDGCTVVGNPTLAGIGEKYLLASPRSY